MSSNDSLAALKLLAVRRRSAMRLLDADIAKAVSEGRLQGLTMARMADELGLTRQGLYDLINRTKEESNG